ncbi:MAG TPA: nuclear transport factor 2 family protein [Allosphingosinicella sp.]|nr:nuclear transport factor 2 family protein [Allosphingosinicella sp.]
MAIEDNVHVIALRHAYARWRETKGGSAEEILELFDDKIEMRSVLAREDVPSELAGRHATKAEAAEYFAALARDWEMIDYVVDQFIADGEYGEDVVMVGRCAWRHRATGALVASPKIDIWRFEFGKATRFTEMFDSLAFARAVGAVS